VLDSPPALGGRSDGESDCEKISVNFQAMENVGKDIRTHVRGLAFVTFEGVALVLLDLEKLHGKKGVLALGHLHDRKVGELKAGVVLLEEVLVDGRSVFLAVVTESIELGVLGER
jgi:hypothetical protein